MKAVLGALAVGLAAGALWGIVACNPQEQAAVQGAETKVGGIAYKAEPAVFGLCGLAETTAALDPQVAGTVDFVCATAEETDKLLAQLAARQVPAKVAARVFTVNDAGGVESRYLVRCNLPVDAGGPG